MKTIIGAAEPPEPEPMFAHVTITYTTSSCPESGWSVLDCRCVYHRPDLHPLLTGTAALPLVMPGDWPVANTTAASSWTVLNLNVPVATAGG